jgi:hypothetical protein
VRVDEGLRNIRVAEQFLDGFDGDVASTKLGRKGVPHVVGADYGGNPGLFTAFIHDVLEGETPGYAAGIRHQPWRFNGFHQRAGLHKGWIPDQQFLPPLE